MPRNPLVYDQSAFMIPKENEGASTGNIIIQYPNSISQMQVPANSTVVTVNTSVGKKLKSISVSIPANCIMLVHDGSSEKFFFSDESGTQDLPDGMEFDQIKITLSNATASPARFTYRLVFG